MLINFIASLLLLLYLMYDLCCVGHITLDKVITPHSTFHMAGGTSWYFSQALSRMEINYILITAVAESELRFVEELRGKGITVQSGYTRHSVYFENSYAADFNYRTQRVLRTADPFTMEELQNTPSRYYHIGPLLAEDIPLEVIRLLASHGTVSLDAQGYLRTVQNEKVFAADWPQKKEALPLITILKVNDEEMTTLTGCTEVETGAKVLAQWGVKEVVITLGSRGSVIYCNNVFYKIPAYPPLIEADATGCGDTYMAGYLYMRSRNIAIRQAGEFAAAMASKKMEAAGPFTGTADEVEQIIRKHQTS